MATAQIHRVVAIIFYIFSKKSHFYLQIQKVVVYFHYTSCLIHKEYYKYGERCNDK